MSSISSSVSTVSTSCSFTQENLLPSPSAIIPTIKKTETRSLTTPNKFAALSTETQPLVPLPESVPTTSNSEHSNAPEIPQCIKRNSRNRRKRPKVQKLEIEIKMAPHRPRKAAPIEYATDDENMITFDVEEEELVPDPTVKFALKENPINYPKGYLRALTPTRFRKKAGGIIGPYFFKNDEGHNVTVNGDRYTAMITNFFIPELNNHDVQELWFQQEGATCHTARATIDLLKDTFGDRLISRFGPVNWPPRSYDLTPPDYFLWGYVKSLVYADKPQTLDHLEDNIHRVIADIRPQMLEKVIENWTSRLDYIRASRGSPMPEIIFKM
ncbi:transposable element Tc3 transposase [Trichonephila clavipes]|nr:transposable element Tc3 transposase [Trichonephila clavipes]